MLELMFLVPLSSIVAIPDRDRRGNAFMLENQPWSLLVLNNYQGC